MDRAARQHRREAKAARQRKRKGRSKAKAKRRDDSHKSKLRIFREA